jgi:myo-inositol-1(or 4)-monophosphatase
MLVDAMWKKELSVAREAARRAGKILNRTLGQVNHVVKKGDIDLVTEADLESEKAILDIIGRNFPQDSILSEEAGKHDKVLSRTWIVDPLDGTTNFAHGFPFFAISIALEIEKEIVLGIVFNPYVDELFEAVKGMGAYLNNKPIKVSKAASLGESLLATGFPYNIHEEPKLVMDLLEKMVVKARGVRRPGSAAIDLCYVAAGIFDGFWEQGLKPWDTAAGTIIVKEAGGKVSTYEGTPYDPYKKTIVAANPSIHDAMTKLLSTGS